jgi:hypothetical protein
MIGHPIGLPTGGTDASHELTLSDEEVSDVSLATFYVFDKERAGPPAFTLVRGCGRCAGCARAAPPRVVPPLVVRSRAVRSVAASSAVARSAVLAVAAAAAAIAGRWAAATLLVR